MTKETILADDKKAQSIAKMGLVVKYGDKYQISVPASKSNGGIPSVNHVSKDEINKVICDCEDFKSKTDEDFRCVHIKAVKFALLKNMTGNINAPIRKDDTPSQEALDSEVKNLQVERQVDEEEEDDILEPLPPNSAIQADANELPHKVKYDEQGRVDLFKYQVLKNLRKPVPSILLSEKRAGGASIDYINVTDLKDILDIRVGVWTAEVREYKQIGDELIMIVRITVHAKDGDFFSDGTGHNKVNHNAFGDTASNSYAQAFRRAAEGLGLARELWRGKEKIDNKKEQRYNDRQPPQQKQYQQATMSSIQNGLASSLSDLVSAKQLGMIRNMAKEKKIDPNEITMKQWNIKIDELSKKAASALIDHLK